MGFIRRYQSDIYGNWRLAALRYGLLTALVMGAVVLFLKLIYYPVGTPENYASDLSLFAATLFFAWRYRKSLPEGRVFFKELMLMGLGLGVVAAFFYGLFLLFYGAVVDHEFAARCLEHFVNGELNGTADPADKEATVAAMQHYTLLTWALIGAFRTAVMAILTAFIAALVFRTEKNVPRQPANKSKK